MSTDDLIRQLRAEYGSAYTYIHEQNGVIVCLSKFLFSTAILTDVSLTGYTNRYCYHDYYSAFVALFMDWENEPDGWHRAICFGEVTRKRCDHCKVIYLDGEFHQCAK